MKKCCIGPNQAASNVNIAELRGIGQWCLWKEEERGGKFTKVPYSVNGSKARANDLSTCSKYDDVMNAYKVADGGYSGIGFVFHESNGLVGIDLDGMIEQVNGKPVLSEAAKEILSHFNSYAELSPSLRGIHIICKGTLAKSFNHRGDGKFGVEAYSTGRYFTMTGVAVEGYDVPIRDAQEAIDWLLSKFGPKDRTKYLPAARKAKVEKAETSWLWKAFSERYGSPESLHIILSVLSSNGFSINYKGSDYISVESPHSDEFSTAKTDDDLHVYAWFNTHALHSTDKSKIPQLGMEFIEKYMPVVYSQLLADASNFKTKVETAKVSMPAFSVADTKETEVFGYRDAANDFVANSGERFLYIPEAKRTVRWTGKIWQEVSDEVLSGHINQFVAMRESLSSISTSSSTMFYRKKCQGAHRSPMIAAIKDNLSLHRRLADFNANPNIINVRNGILNLETFALTPHIPEALCTQMADVDFDTNAATPTTWHSFLKSVACEDNEVVAFLKRCAGISTTGTNPERAWVNLIGSGTNGKSTFVNVIKSIMGTYAGTMNPACIIKGTDRDRFGLACIEGKRLIVTSEPSAGEKLNDSMIKRVTGNEEIEVEKKGVQGYSILPYCKLWVTANTELLTDDKSNAIFTRMKIIPFRADFRGKEDTDIEKKLLAEKNGIFLWMLKGLQDYRKIGLAVPESITQYAQSVKETTDELEQFMGEVVQKNDDTKVSAVALYNAFKAYCEGNGNFKYIISHKRFSSELRVQYGMIAKRESKGMYYKGITLRSSQPTMDTETLGFN